MLQTVLFYLSSFGVVLFGLGVVLSRSAIYSVLSLVAALCMMAGLFVLLKAFLVATILVMVYAGAILVLFLFVVMMVDYRKLSSDWSGLKLSPLLGVGAGLLMFVQIFGIIRGVRIEPVSQSAAHGTAQAVGAVLFSKYVLPFELTSFLLLSAIVSVVVLAKKDAA